MYLIQSNYLSGNWENLEKPENAKTGGEIIRKYTFFKSEGLGSGTVCVKEFCGFWTLLDHCSGQCCKMCTVIQLPLQVKKFFHYCKYRSTIGEVCHTDMQTTNSIMVEVLFWYLVEKFSLLSSAWSPWLMHWFDLWKACVMYVQVNLTTVYFCCPAIFRVFCMRTITSVLRYSFNVCMT